MQFHKADKIFFETIRKRKEANNFYIETKPWRYIKYFLVYYAERIYERSMFIDKEGDWKQFVLLLICLGAFAGKA